MVVSIFFYWNTSGFPKNHNFVGNFICMLIRHPVELFLLTTTSHGKSNLPPSSSEGSKAHKINCLVHAFFTFSFYNNMRARVQKLIIYSASLCTTHLHMFLVCTYVRHGLSYQDNFMTVGCFLHLHYGNTGCGVFKGGIQN